MKNFSHTKLNLKSELINCLIKDAELKYGGKGNKTITSSNFRNNIGLHANLLVNGKI